MQDLVAFLVAAVAAWDIVGACLAVDNIVAVAASLVAGRAVPMAAVAVVAAN